VTSWRCPDEVGDCHTSQAAWWLRFQDEHRAHKGKPHDQCRAKTRALRRLQGSLRLAIGGRGDEYLDNSRYRGSAAAGGGAIIAGPWSEFQRPRELPLSRVRSGRRLLYIHNMFDDQFGVNTSSPFNYHFGLIDNTGKPKVSPCG